MAFNPSVWAQDTPSSPKRNEPTARQQMLAAVVTQVIPGKSRAALEAALGPQENTDKFKGLGRDMIWKLGPQRDTFIGLDSEWLLIWLDAKGQYERHMIAND